MRSLWIARLYYVSLCCQAHKLVVSVVSNVIDLLDLELIVDCSETIRVFVRLCNELTRKIDLIRLELRSWLDANLFLLPRNFFAVNFLHDANMTHYFSQNSVFELKPDEMGLLFRRCFCRLCSMMWFFSVGTACLIPMPFDGATVSCCLAVRCVWIAASCVVSVFLRILLPFAV